VSEPDWKAALRADLGEAFDAAMPHIEAAFKRGFDRGRSRASYRVLRENERLRRELELAHREGKEEPCRTDTAGAAGPTPASPTEAGDDS
jgi:hypothetical protein